MRPEGLDHWHIASVAASGNGDPADPPHVVPRVEGEPTSIQIHLKSGIEIHRRGIARHADVAEVAVDVARGDVHAAAERDGEMGEVSADINPLPHPR